jgi:hypothetical protein
MSSPENHKAIILRLFEDVWSEGDFDQVSLYVAPRPRVLRSAPI